MVHKEFHHYFLRGLNGLYFIAGFVLGAAVVAWVGLLFGFLIRDLSPVFALEDVWQAPAHEPASSKIISHLPDEPIFSQPYEARAVYLAATVVANAERLEALFDNIRNSHLNAVVIDVKDFDGEIAFRPRNPELQKYAPAKARIENMAGIVRRFRHAGIYTIARIPVFQDSAFAERMPEVALHDERTGRIWRNSQGSAWLDPASETVWAYTALLAKEAHAIGFDEINFDYVRFPSDGKLGRIVYPVWDKTKTKNEVIESFFAYLDEHTRSEGIVTSVDEFGMVLLQDDGLEIGQRLSSALAHFDYVSPMMYPSHYPRGFAGYGNPAAHPGEVIAAGFGNADNTLKAYPDSRIRPWFQDFDIGARYAIEEIREQVSASEASGGFGWLLWNANNRYTDAVFTEEWGKEQVTRNE